jgi:hypothetical protein
MITLNVAVASKVRRLNVGGLNGRLAYLLDLMKLAFKDKTLNFCPHSTSFY